MIQWPWTNISGVAFATENILDTPPAPPPPLWLDISAPFLSFAETKSILTCSALHVFGYSFEMQEQICPLSHSIQAFLLVNSK